MSLLRSDETMAELGVSSKLNADWDFSAELRDQGREQASRWLRPISTPSAAARVSISAKPSSDPDPNPHWRNSHEHRRNPDTLLDAHRQPDLPQGAFTASSTAST